VDDMCYDRRRAEACVDESARHALANAGGREIVGKKEGFVIHIAGVFLKKKICYEVFAKEKKAKYSRLYY